MFVPVAFPKVVWPVTDKYPLAVKFVDETDVSDAWPVVESDPNVPAPVVVIVVPVAFVKVIP